MAGYDPSDSEEPGFESPRNYYGALAQVEGRLPCKQAACRFDPGTFHENIG